MTERRRSARLALRDPIEIHARRLYAEQMKRYSARIGRELDIPFDRLDPITQVQWRRKAREHPSEVKS